MEVPRVLNADLILDSRVYSMLNELHGATAKHHLHFISREYDIHLDLAGAGNRKTLYGQVKASGLAPESCLVTLIRDGESYAASETGPSGGFKFHRIRSGSTTLEILVASRRITATFYVNQG